MTYKEPRADLHLHLVSLEGPRVLFGQLDPETQGQIVNIQQSLVLLNLPHSNIKYI